MMMMMMMMMMMVIMRPFGASDDAFWMPCLLSSPPIWLAEGTYGEFLIRVDLDKMMTFQVKIVHAIHQPQTEDSTCHNQPLETDSSQQNLRKICQTSRKLAGNHK